jgi:hypothetical protein
MKLSKTKRVEPIQPITRTEPVKRRETPYQGDIDPAVIIHSNKTHRTASEAFKDANYAQAFWRSKTDWEESMDFLAGAILGFMWVGVVAGVVGAVVYWLFFS